jgi:hypothetical protein
MTEPKPFASLSSSLLARKGHAKPAMRPQAFHISGDLSRPAQALDDDLGWNDMGEEADNAASLLPVAKPEPVAPLPIHGGPVVTDVPSPAIEQQALLKEQFTAPDLEPESEPVAVIVPAPVAVEKPAARRAAGSKPKAAFTLRLDADRHLQLRLVCAVQHRSAQQVVTQALDDFLARQPGIDAAASRRTV